MRTLWTAGLLIFCIAQGAKASDYFKCVLRVSTFTCQDITRSSFIERVCFDTDKQYMFVKSNGTYYKYCKIGPEVVSRFLAAPSMGKFYNAQIRGNVSEGPFDCRTHQIPKNSR